VFAKSTIKWTFRAPLSEIFCQKKEGKNYKKIVMAWLAVSHNWIAWNQILIFILQVVVGCIIMLFFNIRMILNFTQFIFFVLQHDFCGVFMLLQVG
jgi:hypothetical protein